jgi:hypothetical protein
MALLRYLIPTIERGVIMATKKYYAAENTMGFENTWDVLVFDSKRNRDDYIERRDGYDGWTGRNIQCLAIRKNEVTQYAANYSLTHNRYNTPKPFSGECWMISHWHDRDAPGFIGEVFVGHPEQELGIRLY